MLIDDKKVYKCVDGRIKPFVTFDRNVVTHEARPDIIVLLQATCVDGHMSIVLLKYLVYGCFDR